MNVSLSGISLFATECWHTKECGVCVFLRETHTIKFAMQHNSIEQDPRMMKDLIKRKKGVLRDFFKKVYSRERHKKILVKILTSIFDDFASNAEGHGIELAHPAGPRLKPGAPAQLRPQEETPPAGGSNPAETTQQTKHSTAGCPSNQLPNPTACTAVNKGKGKGLSRSEQIRSPELRSRSSCRNYAASKNNATK